jgi:hypothetical protein
MVTKTCLSRSRDYFGILWALIKTEEDYHEGHKQVWNSMTRDSALGYVKELRTHGEPDANIKKVSKVLAGLSDTDYASDFEDAAYAVEDLLLKSFKECACGK